MEKNKCSGWEIKPLPGADFLYRRLGTKGTLRYRLPARLAGVTPVNMKIKLMLIPFLICCTYAQAQTDNLFAELDSLTETKNQEVIAAFKSTRVMLAPSVERVRRRQLHFRVSHLFSSISTGYTNLFGLDQLVNMNLSLEYGLSNRIQVGLARSNKADKALMPNLKVSLLRQTSGPKSFPFYLSWFGNADLKTNRYAGSARNDYLTGRLDYVNMLLIGRKFSKRLSLQLSPAWLHRNLTETTLEPNDLFALGFSGRYMLNGHVSVNWEYFRSLPSAGAIRPEQDPLSLGFDLETGGHVFQLYFTNALALHPGKFLRNQNENFFRGNVQFGFSIMREFNF